MRCSYISQGEVTLTKLWVTGRKKIVQSAEPSSCPLPQPGHLHSLASDTAAAAKERENCAGCRTAPAIVVRLENTAAADHQAEKLQSDYGTESSKISSQPFQDQAGAGGRVCGGNTLLANLLAEDFE